MTKISFRILLIVGLLIVQLGCSDTSQDTGDQIREDFVLEEITITDIHGVLEAGGITCRDLVDAYLRRIDVYDQATGLTLSLSLTPVLSKLPMRLMRNIFPRRLCGRCTVCRSS